MTLPVWATVAFAGRCGRRIQTHLAKCCPKAPKWHADAFEYCLCIAEGRVGCAVPLVNSTIEDLTNAFNDSEHLESEAPNLSVIKYKFTFQVGVVTAYAVKAALVGQKWAAADNASDAARQMCGLFKGNYQIVEDIRNDFWAISNSSIQEGWDDSSMEPLSFYLTQAPLVSVDYDECI